MTKPLPMTPSGKRNLEELVYPWARLPLDELLPEEGETLDVTLHKDVGEHTLLLRYRITVYPDGTWHPEVMKA